MRQTYLGKRCWRVFANEKRVKLTYCYHWEVSDIKFHLTGYANIRMRPAILTNGRSRTNVLYVISIKEMIEFFNIANDCTIAVLSGTIILFVGKSRRSESHENISFGA